MTTTRRWPLVAAAAAPAWAAAFGRRRQLATGGRWVAGLALPILVAHQTEEWVKPGGFLPFANQRLLGSDRPAWPLTERLAFHVNVTAGWGSAVAGMMLWRRSPAVAAGVVAMEVGNVAMHAALAPRERGYNPGVVTAVALMAPHSAASAVWLKRSGRMTRSGVAATMAIGGAFAARRLVDRSHRLTAKCPDGLASGARRRPDPATSGDQSGLGGKRVAGGARRSVEAREQRLDAPSLFGPRGRCRLPGMNGGDLASTWPGSSKRAEPSRHWSAAVASPIA